MKCTECKTNQCLTSSATHSQFDELQECYRRCYEPLLWQQRYMLAGYKRVVEGKGEMDAVKSDYEQYL